jgi:hypothetical protein
MTHRLDEGPEMRKLLICLPVMMVALTACVHIEVDMKEADEPVVSFDVVTLTPGTDATPLPHTAMPTNTPCPTADSAPTHTATPTSIPTDMPTSTPTRTPTNTPTPAPCLPNAVFVTDVTIPDNTALSVGQAFQKVWRIRSSGCAPWPDGTRWVFISGERMGAPKTVAVADTPVGGTADIAVSMVAPDIPATCQGYWQMQSPDGTLFGDRAYVQIVVSEPTSVPPSGSKPRSPKPTSQPLPTSEPPPP